MGNSPGVNNPIRIVIVMQNVSYRINPIDQPIDILIPYTEATVLSLGVDLRDPDFPTAANTGVPDNPASEPSSDARGNFLCFNILWDPFPRNYSSP